MKLCLKLYMWFGTFVVAILSLVTSNSHAQTFHENDWVYISSAHPLNHTLLEGPYKEGPESSILFYPFMASNSYPGALSGGGLWCYKSGEVGPRDDVQKTGHYSLETSLIDNLLENLKRDSKWMVSGSQSFAPVYTYATGPRYRFVDGLIYGYSLEAVGDVVNYVGCSPGLNLMAVNSQYSTKGSNFMTIGEDVEQVHDKPMVLDHMPMHELIHVHQNNYAPYKSGKVDLGKTSLSWLIEGTADAVAMHRVHTLHGGHKAVLRKIDSYESKFHRRFYLLRNYNIPLNYEPANGQLYTLEDLSVTASIDKRMLGMLGYETNGFWFHIMERYLKKDAGNFTDLFSRLDTISAQNTAKQVDIFLDRHDGKALRGLEHVYPQFLAEFTNWWEVRTANKISENKWLNIAYNGCAKFDLTSKKTNDTKPLEVSDYAAKCVDIKIDSSAAQRLNDVQLSVAGADQSSDDIYLAMSRITGTKQGDVSCFDIVQTRGVYTAPCLMDPHQGFANWKGGAAAPKRTLLRTFNVTDLQSINGQEIAMRLVVVRVPAKHYDVVGKLNRKKLDLTVSLDLASLQPKSGQKPKKRTVMKYSTRQGEGPVSPDGKKSVFDATLEDALRGNVAKLGAPGLKSQALNQLIAVELIDEDDTNFSVGFFLQDLLTEGASGPVKVTGVMGDRKINGTQVISHQDPDYDTTLDILEYSEATLKIRGQVNVCIAPLSAMMKLKDGENLCHVGERQSYGIEGAVAFPTLINGKGDFTTHASPAYEAYKDLRMARMRLVMGGSLEDGTPSINSTEPVASTDRSLNGTGMLENMCPIIAPTGSCDCSCDAKKCVEDKLDSASLRPQEKACRLTCGKRWKSCAVSGATP